MAAHQLLDRVCHEFPGEITVLTKNDVQVKAQMEKMAAVAAQVLELEFENEKVANTFSKCEADLVEESAAKNLALSSL